MSVIDILVPQMGEGLQEVLIVEFFKKPGDRIKRDEPFYSMETDKATMEVECPHEGTLIEWLAAEGDTLAIGVPVCRMEVTSPPQPSLPTAKEGELEGAVSETLPLGEGLERGDSTDLRAIPPRTRAYAKEKGIDDSTLAHIPIASGKLMPSDIDAYLKVSPLSGQGEIQQSGGV